MFYYILLLYYQTDTPIYGAIQFPDRWMNLPSPLSWECREAVISIKLTYAA